MSREIRFRAWDKSEKNWITPENVNLYTEILDRNLGAEQDDKLVYFVVGGIANSGIIFQQSIGLKDKNDKEIYEGDIFEIDEDIRAVIEFRNGSFKLISYGVSGALMEYGFDENAGGYGEIEEETLDYYHMDTYEIIGNKCEHPELLK
jgi:uncharacterized phage protein (TIGR01671 family)